MRIDSTLPQEVVDAWGQERFPETYASASYGMYQGDEGDAGRLVPLAFTQLLIADLAQKLRRPPRGPRSPHRAPKPRPDPAGFALPAGTGAASHRGARHRFGANAMAERARWFDESCPGGLTSAPPFITPRAAPPARPCFALPQKC